MLFNSKKQNPMAETKLPEAASPAAPQSMPVLDGWGMPFLRKAALDNPSLGLLQIVPLGSNTSDASSTPRPGRLSARPALESIPEDRPAPWVRKAQQRPAQRTVQDHDTTVPSEAVSPEKVTSAPLQQKALKAIRYALSAKGRTALRAYQEKNGITPIPVPPGGPQKIAAQAKSDIEAIAVIADISPKLAAQWLMQAFQEGHATLPNMGKTDLAILLETVQTVRDEV